MPARIAGDDAAAARPAVGRVGANDEWGDDARRYARLAIAESTRRTYAAAEKSYAAFCTREQRPMHPITTADAARWLASLAKAGELMGDTIAGYRSALSTCHREHSMGQGANPLESPIISAIVEGIRRDLRASDAAKQTSRPKTIAITPTILRDIESRMPSDEPMATMVRAAASLAVYAMLRPSELLGSAQHRDRALRFDQITFYESAAGHAVMPLLQRGVDIDRARCPERYTVKLLIAKNDQEGKKPAKPVVHPAAVKALWRWCHLRNSLGVASSRLFHCAGVAPLSCAELLRRMQVGLARIGYPDVHLTGKCFRRGGATGLVQSGASNASVAALAGWASGSMVERYAEQEAVEARRIETSRRLAPTRPAARR